VFFETRLNFVNLNGVHYEEVDHILVLCSGKLCCNFMDLYIPTKVFHMLIHSVPLHGITVGVWCAMVTPMISGPLFSESITSH
jgi:hypothetical protein